MPSSTSTATEVHSSFAFSDLVASLESEAEGRPVLDLARGLSRRSGIPLELVTVNSPGTAERRDRDELQAALDRAGAEGRPVVLHGDDVAVAVAEHLDQLVNPLVCMVSRGRRPFGAMVLGSASEELLRRTRHPVLLVGPKARAITTLSRTLVACLDGTDASEHILPVVLAWTSTFGGDVLAVRHVADDVSADDVSADEARIGAAQLERAVVWLRERDVAAGSEVIEGRSASIAICEVARRVGVSAVAMTTHARPPLRRIEFGSVALDVLRDAERPVLLVNPAAA